jgi:GDP-L-fucose synthase
MTLPPDFARPATFELPQSMSIPGQSEPPNIPENGRIAGARVLVTGHRGMVGSAIVRRLRDTGCNILTLGRETADLRRQSETEDAIKRLSPDLMFIASAHVGGISANSSRPADFIYDNIMIEANLIEAARQARVKKLLFLGSSCIYPRLAPQPMQEEYLLSGPLEPTNQWYAVAKIAGIKMCAAYRRQYGCDYISAQPSNLYGPGDNFDLEDSHVIPALIAKIHTAKTEGRQEVELWGAGSVRREFMHVDDLADALVFLMENYSQEQHINVGFGSDTTIGDLANLIAKVVGFGGSFKYSTNRPAGPPQKLLDTSRINALGWHARTSLADGLARTYAWYRENQSARTNSK